LLQGQALDDVEGQPEIVGADDPETAQRASALLASLGSTKKCFHVSTVEAELAKLYLNAYRYTLFGLANEFAFMAEQYSADVYAILHAANADYARGGIPLPGPSRGPCLGKDTATLAFSTADSLITHAALKTNENVPLYVSRELRAALGSLVGRRVTVLGLAFKADSDDTRDNMSTPLVNLLDREGAATTVYDPLIAGYDDPETVRGSDVLILMTPHRAFAGLTCEEVAALSGRAREDVFIFDLWNVWPWADRTFGRGGLNAFENSRDRGMRVSHARGRASAD